jgi:hypothetical protein
MGASEENTWAALLTVLAPYLFFALKR